LTIRSKQERHSAMDISIPAISVISPMKTCWSSAGARKILNLGGDKVSPRTIEDALRAFYGIRDAAAFSVANGLGIDEVWALVVPNGRLNEEALQKHCRERLAQTHVPVRFINVADIPRNANGKVDRGRLNAMVQGFTASTA
jgi:acyl-CoA synthetase (AMP-forming)/AMP-acid ligase II